MAKKPKVEMTHAEHMGMAAHAGMRHLTATGTQTATMAIDFAELQDKGPTPRDPRPYATVPVGDEDGKGDDYVVHPVGNSGFMRRMAKG